jgi:hypothetical protein
MARGFRNMSELSKALEKHIKQSMENEVAEVVKDVMQEKINDEVYMSYRHSSGDSGRQEPYRYERRYYEGGLIDRDNIAHEVSKDGTLTVENIAKGKDSGDDLAPLIEMGHNKGYGSYDYTSNRDNTQDQYLQPRPFIAKTREELQKEGKHIKALKDGLKKQGLRVED